MTVPLPPVTRIRCWVCGEMKPAATAEKIMLQPRRFAWRCRACAS